MDLEADAAARSADVVYDLLSSLLRRVSRDLSLTSTSALGTLNRTGPRRITDLAAMSGITQPSATTLVATLERAGLVERRSDPADRRVVLVAITEAGSAYMHARRQTGIETFARLIERLPVDEAAALTAALPALRHLREIEDEQRDPGSPAETSQRPQIG